MTDESDIEKIVHEYDRGISETLKHPIGSIRYWNRSDSLMRRIGRLDGYLAYVIVAASIGALTYQLIKNV
jgi:hypothetical protein